MILTLWLDHVLKGSQDREPENHSLWRLSHTRYKTGSRSKESGSRAKGLPQRILMVDLLCRPLKHDVPETGWQGRETIWLPFAARKGNRASLVNAPLESHAWRKRTASPFSVQSSCGQPSGCRVQGHSQPSVSSNSFSIMPWMP